MKIIRFKDNVRVKAWTPALSEIVDTLDRLQNEHDWIPELTVTSVNDSAHLPNSQHYQDLALDVRAHNFQNDTLKGDFVTLLQHSLGVKFLVLFEAVGSANEHFHVHLIRGVTFP